MKMILTKTEMGGKLFSSCGNLDLSYAFQMMLFSFVTTQVLSLNC